MFTKNINFENFKIKSKNLKLRKIFLSIFKIENHIINSLTNNYKNSYSKKFVNKYKKSLNFRIIGMGGSTLGTQAIYNFLNKKIKKNFIFVDNLQASKTKDKTKNFTNLIVSKSGNTIETIANTNVLIKKKDKNIFLTENTNNQLYILAKKLKSEIVHHNNFIGGRYSVLSEVGMLPAELMGLNVKKFRKLNSLIKNKNFVNSLLRNVSSTIKLIKKKKFNSIIINYDEKSENLFKWYQQLIAESLGKKKYGIIANGFKHA